MGSTILKCIVLVMLAEIVLCQIKIDNPTAEPQKTENHNPLEKLILNENVANNQHEHVVSRAKRQYGYEYPYAYGRRYPPPPILFPIFFGGGFGARSIGGGGFGRGFGGIGRAGIGGIGRGGIGGGRGGGGGRG